MSEGNGADLASINSQQEENFVESVFYFISWWGGGGLNAPYDLVFIILHSPFYLINEDSMPPPRPLRLLFEHQWSGCISENNSNVMYFCSLGILVETMKKIKWCRDLVHHHCEFWMGFNSRAQEGNWVWSNGDPGIMPIIFLHLEPLYNAGRLSVNLKHCSTAIF